MNDNEADKSLFNEGDWVRYNDTIYKVRAVGFHESFGEIVYFLETHNSNLLKKCFTFRSNK